eukprot:scaffold13237_cov124-Isochrysis_galbana.AAC.5
MATPDAVGTIESKSSDVERSAMPSRRGQLVLRVCPSHINQVDRLDAELPLARVRQVEPDTELPIRPCNACPDDVLQIAVRSVAHSYLLVAF